MLIKVKQLSRKDPIVINTDMIVNIRSKEGGNYHIGLTGFGLDISKEEWMRIKEMFLSENEFYNSVGDF